MQCHLSLRYHALNVFHLDIERDTWTILSDVYASLPASFVPTMKSTLALITRDGQNKVYIFGGHTKTYDMSSQVGIHI